MYRKVKVLIIFTFCMIALSVLSVNTVQAANTSKKTLTATIDQKSSNYTCTFNLSKKTKLNTEIKVLSMKGKGKNTKIYWGYYHTDHGKGSLFYDLNPSKLKKNKTLKSEGPNNYEYQEGWYTFVLPEGIEKMKIKITISTVDGKKSIKSFKKS